MRTHDTLRHAPSERDCFADEVAIDFRSLAGVVERMRADFFANEEDPFSSDPPASRPAGKLGGRSER